MNFFEKIFNKKQTNFVPDTMPMAEKNVAKKPDIVKSYVLVNPKGVMLNYELFSLCENIPVAVESKNASMTGICDAIPLPTKEFLPYIRELTAAPDAIAANPAKRTVFVVELLNNEKMYIFPNLKSPKNPYMAFENNVAFNVNPAINAAITKALKNFTR